MIKIFLKYLWFEILKQRGMSLLNFQTKQLMFCRCVANAEFKIFLNLTSSF